jgi:redox-sensing transcriptional repressor
MLRFEDFCRRNDVKIGIITVGEGSAQVVCDQMIASGIKAIWNFAPCRLNVPDDVVFLQENLAISLAYLNNKLLMKQQKETENEY